MLKLSRNLLISPMANSFSYSHFWPSLEMRLLKFSSTCGNNLQGWIFLREINHRLLVFFLPMFIFCQNMYFQNDETDVLEVLEIIFFLLSNHGGHTFFIFCFKFLQWILRFGSGISLILLNIKKRLKNLKIYVSNIIRISQNLWEEIWDC